MCRELIRLALEEDIGSGDVTAEYFVPEERMASACVVAREEGVVSGITVAKEVFLEVDSGLEVRIVNGDGARVSSGTVLIVVEGKARSIMTAERTALNFIQRLSGVATLTSRYVDLVKHTGVGILDTRKTTPGYRLLEKQAVVHGGGINHRMGLYDRAMVKDNHLATVAAAGELQQAILRLKAERPEVEVELEADRIDQVRSFLALAGVDHILLDNMGLDDMREAVRMRGASDGIRLEASGGVNLQTVRAIAETGVDFISVGALTHSAPAMDVALDIA